MIRPVKECPYLGSNNECRVWLPQPSGAIWLITYQGYGEKASLTRTCGVAAIPMRQWDDCDAYRSWRQVLPEVKAERLLKSPLGA